MLLLKLKGGLGNQLFQYAAAKQFAIQGQVPLKLDVCSGFQGDPYKRRYALTNFAISDERASPEEIVQFSRGLPKALGLIVKYRELFRIRKLGYHFDPLSRKLVVGQSIYLDGYFQSHRYFNDIGPFIRGLLHVHPQVFIEQNAELLYRITGSEAVAVHVRRTLDAVPASVKMWRIKYGSCTTEYYQAAMKRVCETVRNPCFYVFGDDYEWARHHLRSDYPIVFACDYGKRNAQEDLQLMALCKHFVIANSTFSWWAAWLGTHSNKIAIAPTRWYESIVSPPVDLIPEDWVKI